MATTSFQWEQSRWGDFQQAAYDRLGAAPPPPLSAPTAINPAAQSSILRHHRQDSHLYNPHTRASAEQIRPTQPASSDIYTTASVYSDRHKGRHSPAYNGSYPRQQLADRSLSSESQAGAWRSSSHDSRRTSMSNTAHAQLSLHIPQSHGPYYAALIRSLGHFDIVHEC